MIPVTKFLTTDQAFVIKSHGLAKIYTTLCISLQNSVHAFNLYPRSSEHLPSILYPLDQPSPFYTELVYIMYALHFGRHYVLKATYHPFPSGQNNWS